MAQRYYKAQQLAHEFDMLNDPAGIHPSRKVPRWRYNAINYTAVLQDYLDALHRDDLFSLLEEA